MIFYIDVSLLTSIPADLNNMTHVGVWIELTALAHVEQSAGETNCHVPFHTKSRPLVGTLQNVAMRETYIIVETHLPVCCILHFAIVHVLR